MSSQIPKSQPPPQKLTHNLNLLLFIVSKRTFLNSSGFGLCPFHEEKTPSFHIFLATSGRARYHCFGCGEGGDIFNYLHKIEKIPYSLARNQLIKIINSDEVFKNLNFDLSFSSRAPEHPVTFCERDCEKYLLLKEDYEWLLAENYELKQRLGEIN